MIRMCTKGRALTSHAGSHCTNWLLSSLSMMPKRYVLFCNTVEALLKTFTSNDTMAFNEDVINCPACPDLVGVQQKTYFSILVSHMKKMRIFPVSFIYKVTYSCIIKLY